MSDETFFTSRSKPFAPPSGWPRLVLGAVVLACCPSVAAAEETRARWATFGLHVEVLPPRSRKR